MCVFGLKPQFDNKKNNFLLHKMSKVDNFKQASKQKRMVGCFLEI
jgi:hypothetical protein